METISALGLLFVGMLTVFVILALVVLTGNLVIKAVNRFMPLAAVAPKVSAATSSSQSPSQVAAIVAAVDVFTAGKGRVESIQKIK